MKPLNQLNSNETFKSIIFRVKKGEARPYSDGGIQMYREFLHMIYLVTCQLMSTSWELLSNYNNHIWRKNSF